MNSYYIQDICSIKGGKRIPKGETLQIEPNGHPYIRILDMAQGRVLNISSDMQYAREKYLNKIKKYIVHTDDVILSIVGSLGLVSVIGPSLNGANLTENCCKFVDIDESRILPMFLYYALISPFNQDQIKKFQVGSMQPKLPMYNIQKLLIPKIPIEKQQKIINVLSPLDSKIENNNKINSELESLAKTIYDYWFLQFDFPNEEGKPYKSSGGAMEYNEELKMDIPKGWEVKPLGSIIVEQKKSTIPVEDAKNADGDFPFFTSGDAILRYNNKIVSGRNLFLNTGGKAGLKYYVGDVAYSTDTWCISGIDNLSDYLYLNLAKIEYALDRVYFTGSTGLEHLQKPLLKKREILVPPSHILDKFNKIVQPMFDMISENTRENQELSDIRDYLLPLLMNGQVGFKDE